MSKQLRIYPYKIGSNSASLLAESLRSQGLRTFKVYPDRNYNPRNNHVVINWGAGSLPVWYGGRYYTMINNCERVAGAANKLISFQELREGEVNIPDFTTDRSIANEWIREGHIVVVRQKLTGHSGEGIILVSGNDTVPKAPLYVKYMKKKHEYRVHVFAGQVIDIQQKRRRTDEEPTDYKVRNHANGWVYCRHDISVPHSSVCEQAVRAVSALGLDFGAVDVLWNNHYQLSTVLEVNTAPGLEGETVTHYTNAIRRYTNALL